MDFDPAAVGAMLIAATPLILLIVRIFVIPDGASLDDLVAPRIDLDWPRGVEEEEPVRWRVERLTPRVGQAAEPPRGASGVRASPAAKAAR